MSSQPHSAHDDLAFLRGLVDEDWRPGLWAFGALYLCIGVTLCIHVFISWGAKSGMLPLHPGAPLIGAYVVLYGVLSIVITWISGRIRRDARGLTPGVKSRAGGAALAGAFLAHLVMLAVFVIIAVRRQDSFFVELAPLVLFASQGAMWFVVSAMRRQRWHVLEAWGWYAATLALAPFVGTDAYGLGIALAVIVLMIVPGVVMMRAARAAA